MTADREKKQRCDFNLFTATEESNGISLKCLSRHEKNYCYHHLTIAKNEEFQNHMKRFWFCDKCIHLIIKPT